MSILSSILGIGGNQPQPVAGPALATQKIPEELAPYYKDILGKAQALYKEKTAEGFQPYQGPTIAQFTPEQEQAFTGLAGLTGQQAPVFQEAMDMTRAAGNSLVLNSNANLYTNQSYKGWGGVMPTSTVFTVDGNNANGSGESIVVYCFANCEGYIKSGTYQGNGESSDGTFVYTGFKPAWILVKRLSGSKSWLMQDNARDTYNPIYHLLKPNTTAAEEAYTDGTDYNDFLSNGFKVARGGDAANWNADGETYVFLAMAHNPFKYATSR